MTPWDIALAAANRTQFSVCGALVSYRKPGQESVPLRAILEDLPAPDSMEVETGQGVAFAPGGRYRRVCVALSDLPTPPAEGDEVGIGDLSYRVIHVSADESGGARLTLHLP